jgi:hypothetical protein
LNFIINQNLQKRSTTISSAIPFYVALKKNLSDPRIAKETQAMRDGFIVKLDSLMDGWKEERLLFLFKKEINNF